MPVSYTHLDVYKRQVYEWMMERRKESVVYENEEFNLLQAALDIEDGLDSLLSLIHI